MNKELLVNKDVFIVSETDKDGNITNVNDEFLAITGYTRKEIIGKPHNIIRHKDMPKKAFEVMWATIKAGKTWRGIVKNMNKNGDFYWVYATVSPVDRLNDNTKFTSIRQQCTRNEIRQAEQAYKEMI